MTTISDTTTPAAAPTTLTPPGDRFPRATSVIASDATDAPSPPSPISDSWLVSWSVSRSGFPTVAAVGNERAAFPHTAILTAPRYALHLARPLPTDTLLRALTLLRGKRAPRAILLIAEGPRTAAPSYRERLHLDDREHVVRIHRDFGNTPTARPQLVGVFWKLENTFNRPRHFSSAPAPAPPMPARAVWKSARQLLRQSKNGVVRYALPHASLPTLHFRTSLLAQLPPASLTALAADLGYKPVIPFCFAHPSATVSDKAFLRGPLFIDPRCDITDRDIHVGPGWITPASPRVTLQNPHASPTIPAAYFEGPATTHKPAYALIKRAFDIAFSLFVLLITLPICLVTALAVKLYDRGPIFFAHRRETLHGKTFRCLKFRTMVRNAEALKAQLRSKNQLDGPQFKIAHDPRITPIGRFLRASNIDELPQFLNVLRGDMSVVGPRPSPFEENQLCPAWREARLSVRPGITGLWQVSRSRLRGAADFQEWIFYDTQYVERRSLLLDARIVLLTIKELFGKGQ